jgi:glycosyltransferase involved in cell wall biosynthesis
VVGAGHSIQVLSTYPVNTLTVPGDLVILPTLPVAVSRLWATRSARVGSRRLLARSLRRPTPTLVLRRNGSEIDLPRSAAYRELRVLGEMVLRRSVGHVAQIALDDFRPDVVHALRIPYEAMLMAPTMRNRSESFVVSTWGNDFTLWAAKSWAHRRLTQTVLRRTDCLHSDCERDIGLARELGYAGPSVVAPGSGGIDVEQLLAAGSGPHARELLRAPKEAPIIFNPRSCRPYVRNDVFLAALPAVMRSFPAAIAVTVGMDRHAHFQRYAAALGITDSVRFLPAQDRSGMANLFSVATVTVSPTTHDGTPNTVLEAMACGSFPIVGDLDSLREWIQTGVNGLLVDANDPEALSQAMIRGLQDTALRDRAATRNRAIVQQRASREATRPALERLYSSAKRPFVSQVDVFDHRASPV